MMPKRFGAAAMLVAAAFAGAATAGPADSPAADAKRWYENAYAVDFVNGSAGFIDHYSDAIQFVRNDTVLHLDHRGFESALNDIYVAPWTRAGWKNTQLVSVEAMPLGPSAALLKSRWRMTDANGKPVTACALPGWNYVVVRNGGTWKIATEIEADCAP